MHECSRSVAGAQKVDDYVECLGMQERRSLKVFSGGGRSGEYKNARADNRADSQRRQRPRPQSFLQPLARSFRFGDQLVDRLAAEKLVLGSSYDVVGWRLAGRWLRQ